jgi:GH24 family phage-related lysozyme (muramidase)
MNLYFMNLKTLPILALIFVSNFIYSQEYIDVTDQTIKIGGMKEEEIYFGFAEGDKIVFNFNEIDNKELKEIEILEYPSSTKFSDYKTRFIENKIINVAKQGVYIFRFKNSAMNGRICKIKIQRIPASIETKNFNTKVTWETRQETTYKNYTKDVIVGYDTTYVSKTKKEIVKTELKEEMILDKTETVHSRNNIYLNKNSTVIKVIIPQNEIAQYKTQKIISWAYWIGVGKESSEAWAKNVKMFSNVASGAATIFGAGPLGGIAVGTVTSLAMPTSGEDVAYWLIPDYNNAQLFLDNQSFTQFDKGKGIAAFGKNNSRTQGSFYIGLLNDNFTVPIDANVKISVVWEITYFEDKQFTEMNVKPRYEKKEFSEPIVRTFRVPVLGQ